MLYKPKEEHKLYQTCSSQYQ